MGFQDRRYRDPYDGGGPGDRFRNAMRRVFQDDFFQWGIPVTRVFGISVRIHIFYLVYVIGRLIVPYGYGGGHVFTVFSMVTLFVLVLLHEFGHCFACRWVGGTADRIVMWPLGGLAFATPPHNWRAALITTLGGPAVNLALIPVIGAVLWAMGARWDTLIINPLNLSRTFNSPFLQFETSYLRYFVFSAYLTNAALFFFNMLLVMFPMDAGRVLQELLWARMGYRRSMMIATAVGLGVAIVVGGYSLVTKNTMLFAIALFCGLECAQQKRRVQMMEDAEYDVGVPVAYGYGPRRPAAVAATVEREEARKFKAAAKAQERERSLEAEVDRILDKIRASGMASLTKKERATLDEERRRKLEGR